MKNFLALLCLIVLANFSNIANADWFLSSETKALIVKAEAGDTDAQLRVGAAYDFGKGAPRDGNEAMKWYRMAAEQGNAEAQNSVGSGLQAEKRYAEALPWYEKASAQGHALATNNLAYLYDLGLGVTQDRRKGFELYSRAAQENVQASLKPLAESAKPVGSGQIGTVTGSVYEVGRVALHQQWAQLASAQQGTLLVALPTTDVVLYVSESTPAAIEALRALSKNTAAKASNPLSPTIVLKWGNDRWEAVP
jgi:hypothetical protein